MADYNFPGDCQSCIIFGCLDRNQYNPRWLPTERSIDNTKGYGDKYSPSNNPEDLLRRTKIKYCKDLRDKGITEVEWKRINAPGTPVHRYNGSEEPKVIKNEYIIKLQYHYDIAPSNKYTKILSVFDTNRDGASQQALKKYPNAVILDSTRGA